MIELSLTGKTFGTQPVLGPIDLTVSPGEGIAILGPSGIGKSTLLRIIAGLEDAYDGHRRVQGRLSMVFQEPTLLPWRSVVQNITLMTGVPRTRAQQVLTEVGLADKEALYPGQLSLGQQRRLSLARALASDPDILVLDEPFASLDEQVAQEMISLTKQVIHARGMSSLLVTHAQAEATALAEQIYTLHGAPARLHRAA